MPDVVGHYHLLERLGAGGIGELYRARDGQLGRTVAVRMVSEEIAGDPDARARLVGAARAAAALSHPNIAGVYDVGEDNGRLFVAMEFVPGEPLARLIDGRPLSPRRAIGHAIQIADALAEAHAAGMTHGFLSTANIVVTPKGQTKILDIGLAAWSRAARSLEPVDDLWSLGAVLFELLTGTSPLAQAPSTASSRAPDDPDLVRIIGRLRVAAGEGGYGSAATAAAELQAVAARLDERHAPERAPAVSEDRRPVGRSSHWLLWVAAFVGAILAIWLIGRLW